MCMSKRELIVNVSSLEESLANFKEAWEQAEKGEKVDMPLEIVSFESAVTLMKTLTPRRLEVLRQLHNLGKSSIRALAKTLNRDYSNVHQDIKALHQAGLVLQNKLGSYSMPWDKIVTEIPMTILPTHKTKPHQHKKDSVHHTRHM